MRDHACAALCLEVDSLVAGGLREAVFRPPAVWGLPTRYEYLVLFDLIDHRLVELNSLFVVLVSLQERSVQVSLC
jgi:hypothetical protein